MDEIDEIDYIDTNYDDMNDIDYTDMDDLPLADHIEWNHYEPENLTLYAFDSTYM